MSENKSKKSKAVVVKNDTGSKVGSFFGAVGEVLAAVGQAEQERQYKALDAQRVYAESQTEGLGGMVNALVNPTQYEQMTRVKRQAEVRLGMRPMDVGDVIDAFGQVAADRRALQEQDRRDRAEARRRLRQLEAEREAIRLQFENDRLRVQAETERLRRRRLERQQAAERERRDFEDLLAEVGITREQYEATMAKVRARRTR